MSELTTPALRRGTKVRISFSWRLEGKSLPLCNRIGNQLIRYFRALDLVPTSGRTSAAGLAIVWRLVSVIENRTSGATEYNIFVDSADRER